MSSEELKQALDYVNSKEWIFAKTYANTTPHEYIVVKQDNPEHDKEFKFMFELIEKYGRKETFFGKEWTYLYLNDDYKYFAADGKGWEEDRYILNRAREDSNY